MIKNIIKEQIASIEEKVNNYLNINYDVQKFDDKFGIVDKDGNKVFILTVANRIYDLSNLDSTDAFVFVRKWAQEKAKEI